MTAYWLVIWFCVQAGSCENRLVDHAWPNMMKCFAAGQALVLERIGYGPMFTCTKVRPADLPLAPSFVAPERWADLQDSGIRDRAAAASIRA